MPTKMEADGHLFFNVLVLLLAAVVLVPLLQRFGVPSVLGYLAAGVALGPYTPGPVVDANITRPLAEFGVVFLLFSIGLELPLARLKTMRRLIFGLGLLQVFVSAAVLGLAAYWFGQTSQTALVVGVTLAFSSTAAVLALLVERNEAVAHYGRVAISVLIFQDLAVVPVLALLPLLAGEAYEIGGALLLAGTKAAVALAIIYLLGRFVVRPVYRYVSAVRNPEVFSAANLLLVLAVAWLTAQAGMSMALGAFLAGLLVADSPYRHQVEADIEPFRGLLLGLFFMTVGMAIDLPFVMGEWSGVLGLTLAVMATKAFLIWLLCLALKLGAAQGIRVGLLLAQTGEFAFVIFGRAAELGILERALEQTLIASVALSMVMTPLLAWAGRRWSKQHQGRSAESLAPTGTEHLQQHVIIAGYGRVGRLVAGVIGARGIPYVALDLDMDRVALARKDGLPVFYGDASRMSVLRSVGIERARAAVITVNKPGSAERTVASIRGASPGLTIIARAHDLGQERLLSGIGATAVVPETMEASFQIAGLALRFSGVAPEDAERSIQEHRRRHYGMVDAASDKNEAER